jgi:hypothetical protein
MNPRQRLGEQMLRTAYCATIFFALCAGAAYGQDRPKSLREFWRDTPAGWQCPFSNFRTFRKLGKFRNRRLRPCCSMRRVAGVPRCGS